MNERNRRERALVPGEKNRMNEASWTQASSSALQTADPLPAAASMELLAPAGGPAAFNAALAAGADAIYCGLGSSFNARRSADNFDDVSFAAACRRAHLAGSRVYVTVNVVVKWDEMQRVLRLVRRAWLLGADAFIIQDWGLLAQVRATWPEMECHVSTQANIHDARGVAFCREIGACRVTLSRELTLQEIARIAQEGVEVECFGHGALCFCYSGICHMSSMRGDRSANRGACAQPCRLPYVLMDAAHTVVSRPEFDRLLCPKDYCTIDDLPELAQAGVGSLKIEGRMKAPEYVYSVVFAYREALDTLVTGKDSATAAACRHRLLKRSFNRGLTDAYLHGTAGNEMMSYERSNNRGETVGEVVGGRTLEDAVEKKGGLNGGRVKLRRYKQADVDVTVHAPIGKGDLLEIRPLDDPTKFLTALAPCEAAPGDTLTVRAARVMQPGSIVRVIRSEAARLKAEQISSCDYPRKRAVTVRVFAKVGRPFAVELTTADGTFSACAEGFIVEAARTKAVSAAELTEHVGRMGATPFDPVCFDIELDTGCGMSFSAVHTVRAKACDAFEKEILAAYSSREKHTAPLLRRAAEKECRAAEKERHAAGTETTLVKDLTSDCPRVAHAEVCALVVSPRQAYAALDAGASRLYATADVLEEYAWPQELKQRIIPWLDEVCREVDHERLDSFIRSGIPVAVGNISELALAYARGAAPEIRECIPIHNDYALAALADRGACGVWLNSELTLAEIMHLAKNASVPVGYLVSGRTRTMTSEHCVLMSTGKCAHDCDMCKLRLEPHYLCGIDNDYMPVITDLHGRSRIWSPKPFDAVPEVAVLLSSGVSRLMVDATLLDLRQTTSEVERVCLAVRAALKGEPLPNRLEGASEGHLFSSIG